MFNKKEDNESDFCESYKSQILGEELSEGKTSLFSTIIKLFTILLLLSIIIGVSLYGYNYFVNRQNLNTSILPPLSMQTSDDTEEALDSDDKLLENLKVQIEETEKEDIKKENISLPLVITPQVEELEIEKIANDMKIAIAKSEILEENNTAKEENLEVPTSEPEAKYLEELAELSKEIDKERKK